MLNKEENNMEQVYILRVLDADDGYQYITLVLRTEEEFNKAKKLIEAFDATYYHIIDGELESEYDEGIYTGSYYEDLLSYLDKHNIESIPRTEEVIYVR